MCFKALISESTGSNGKKFIEDSLFVKEGYEI